MKAKLNLLGLCTVLSTLNPQLSTLLAQGTAFTYQGRLNDGGGPANGSFDLTFSIWTNSSGPAQASVIVTNLSTPISNGLFTVTLDFGVGVFTGEERWLEIGVRTNGSGPFATLAPRQRLTSTPYAIAAANLTGVISSSSLAGSYSNAVTFDNPANQFSGSFTGNGVGLSNVNAQTLVGWLPSSFWKLTGNNIAPGEFLGGTNDQPLELRANGMRALRLEPNTNGAPNVIGGSSLNQADAGVVGAFIGGGGTVNYLGSVYSNRAAASFAAIGGGLGNSAQGGYSAISGGSLNNVEPGAYAASIGGGSGNLVRSNSPYSSMGGGIFNAIEIYSPGSFIGGGWLNTNGSPYSVIGGGVQNIIQLDGGFGGYSMIGGGSLNTIQTNASSSFIGGGNANLIQSGAFYSSIGGGNANTNGSAYSTIAGGNNNVIQSSSDTSFIGAGWLNLIQSSADQCVIGGGNANHILSGARESFVGSGFLNTLQTNSAFSFIGAGTGNMVGTNSIWGTIAGGQDNSIQAGADHATIGGGTANTNSGSGAFIGGGERNAVRANAQYATISGGFSNSVAGHYGFAAGRRAQARHDGAFVWADSTDTDFASTTSNQFNIRAMGGVRLETAGAGATLDGQPLLSGTVPGASLAGNYPNPVTFANSQNVFIGNGTLLSNVNAATLGGLWPTNFWQLGGNGGTVAGPQFLGTTDGQPLELHVNGARALRLEPSVPDVGPNVIGGYMGNAVVPGGGPQSTIAGGGGPGAPNIIYGQACTIGGGTSNSIGTSFGSIIAGGSDNTIGNGDRAVISGGQLNTIGYGPDSIISGGFRNTIDGALYSTIPGGYSNRVSASYSLAAGYRANATNNGAFVWADSQPADFFSTSNNQFSVRANGGMRLNDDTSVFFGATTRQMLNLYASAYGIGVQSYRMYFRVDAPAGFAWFAGGSHNNATDNPGAGGTELMTLDNSGNLSVRGVVAQNVALTSDRAAKENFKPVDSEVILSKVAALPITRWSFKGDSPTQHIGPMAQDFSAAFGTGSDDKHIAVVDETGVALAAIQGLNQKVDSQNAALREELRHRDSENAELKQTVNELRKLLDGLNEKLNAAAQLAR